MSTELNVSLRRVLPVAVCDRLAEVLQQMVPVAGEGTLVLTETAIAQTRPGRTERFVVVVSPAFSGLLLAAPTVSPNARVTEGGEPESQRSSDYAVELVFAPRTIADFLTQVSGSLLSPWREQLPPAQAQLQPNDPTRQSEFTLKLIEVLTAAPPTPASVCEREVTAALQPQLEQERRLHHVTSLIRQSMDLAVILETAVVQVQQLLQADRVVIYEFKSACEAELEAELEAAIAPLAPVKPAVSPGYGCITYEARAHDQVRSVLDVSEERYCFADVADYRTRYGKGFTLAVEDTYVHFAQATCLLGLMQRAQVRAKLIVPIVVGEALWGLLIAHQCFAPRSWQAHEQTFMQRISEHLAIALHQASLYAQVQAQKQLLAHYADKRTQELYDALSAAQAAHLAKTEFLATMSHELRTPLTSIIGMTTTLLRLPSQGRDRVLSVDRQQDYLRTIQTSGEHLLQLINDILDLSEVEAGRMVLELQTCSLSRLVRECLRLLSAKAEQKQIQLTLDLQLPSSSPAADSFIADPQRIQQILLNLISNAIKFTPPGGRVLVRVWREQELAVLQVEDTGIGIAEQQRSLLFQKFQQLEMSRDRSYEGAGLGLALTKHLVELHRGWIEVESALSVGSTFTVWLPNQSLQSVANGVACLLQDPASQPGRIVLVERNEATANLICDLLTTARYQVVWIDGSAVIPQVEILCPVAVLLSTDLLGTTAAEILHNLRHPPERPAIPVLVLGAPATEDAEAQMDWPALGADDYLAAPTAHPEQLLTKLAAIVRKPGNSARR